MTLQRTPAQPPPRLVPIGASAGLCRWRSRRIVRASPAIPVEWTALVASARLTTAGAVSCGVGAPPGREEDRHDVDDLDQAGAGQ